MARKVKNAIIDLVIVIVCTIIMFTYIFILISNIFDL